VIGPAQAVNGLVRSQFLKCKMVLAPAIPEKCVMHERSVKAFFCVTKVHRHRIVFQFFTVMVVGKLLKVLKISWLSSVPALGYGRL
jgi:hypothetical protein